MPLQVGENAVASDKVQDQLSIAIPPTGLPPTGLPPTTPLSSSESVGDIDDIFIPVIIVLFTAAVIFPGGFVLALISVALVLARVYSSPGISAINGGESKAVLISSNGRQSHDSKIMEFALTSAGHGWSYYGNAVLEGPVLIATENWSSSGGDDDRKKEDREITWGVFYPVIDSETQGKTFRIAVCKSFNSISSDLYNLEIGQSVIVKTDMSLDHLSLSIDPTSLSLNYLFMIAYGTSVAAFLDIIRQTALETDCECTMTLIAVNDSNASDLFHDDIVRLAKKLDHLNVEFLYERVTGPTTGAPLIGTLGSFDVTAFPNFHNAERILVAGPDEFLRSTKSLLTRSLKEIGSQYPCIYYDNIVTTG